jgi:hypothetical protein
LELKRVEDPDVLFLFETKLDDREMERFRWMLGLTFLVVVKPVLFFTNASKIISNKQKCKTEIKMHTKNKKK